MSEDTKNEESENVVFHSEDEIMEILRWDNVQMESINVSEEASLASQQPVAAVWDEEKISKIGMLDYF